MICTCDQYDLAFCALQLTALIKPNWCILLYFCACLHPNTTLMEAGWTTVPCPAITFSILICKSSARTKQSVISVALKTHLETRVGICIYKPSLLHRPNDYIGFTPSCPPTFYNKIAPMATIVNPQHLLLSAPWAPRNQVLTAQSDKSFSQQRWNCRNTSIFQNFASSQQTCSISHWN